MKKITTLLCLLAAALLLSGCCIHHEWADATCTEPKRCVKCGETEGTFLGHQWKDATCTESKTCSVCGMRQGLPLGHTWVERTMKAPKTCSTCGETEGEPIYCYEVPIPRIMAQPFDSIFFLPECIVISENDKDQVHFYNYAETEITTVDIAPEGEEVRTWDYAIMVSPYVKGNTALVTTHLGDGGVCTICLYDQKGGKTVELHVKTDLQPGQYLVPFNISEERYIRLFGNDYDGSGKSLPLVCVDCETGELVEPTNDQEIQTYNGTRYYTAVTMPCAEYKYILVHTKDGRAGYVNSRYNYEEAMYKDATNFNTAGYALVSEDGKTYNLIDTDLNVVVEGCLEGTDASWLGDSVFYVQQNGEAHFYSIK